MKNPISATLSVVLPKLHSKLIVKKITLVAALLAAGLIFSVTEVSHGDVKFSKPVIMLTGTVHSEQTGKVESVKVSIRSAVNKDIEITSSVSNRESGKYLVILAPNTKYVVRLQNATGVIADDEAISTPKVNENTVSITKDFTIKRSSAK